MLINTCENASFVSPDEIATWAMSLKQSYLHLEAVDLEVSKQREKHRNTPVLGTINGSSRAHRKIFQSTEGQSKINWKSFMLQHRTKF